MYIFLLLLIPVSVMLAGLYFFSHKITKKEILIQCGIGLFVVLVCKGIVLLAGYGAGIDKEYWGGYWTSFHYEEEWNEYIHKICTRQVPSGRDSRGNTIYRTETYDCSYVQYHAAKWYGKNSNGRTLSITKQFYNTHKQNFGHKFENLRRNYHTIDGDRYNISIPSNKIIPTVTVNSYINKTQFDSSIYKYQGVKKEQLEKYKLFEYPTPNRNHYAPSVLGSIPKPLNSKSLDKLNATLGRYKQVKVFLLFFNNQPIKAATLQEQYWAGGNKNELVICCGLRNEKIEWTKSFSWTHSRVLVKETESKLLSMGTTKEYIDWLYNAVKDKWKRYEFKNFEYIETPDPLWAQITGFILICLSSGGVAYFCWKKDLV